MSETPQTRDHELTDREQALLTGLADGTLRGRRQRAAEAVAARVPDAADLLRRQQRVALALAGGPATPPTLAPPAVSVRPRRPVLGTRLAAAGAGALAAVALVALAVAFLLPSGHGAEVADVADLHARPALQTAPYPRGGQPALLSARAAGVDFPNWAPTHGWTATGARRDTVDGRATETVYYEHQGHRIAYTVVDGEPLPIPDGAERVVHDGVEVALVRGHDGERFAVFERGGRTCVLSGHVISESTLVDLASWHGDGAVQF